MTTPNQGFVHAQQANDTAIPLIKNIFGVSGEFLGELKTWFEQNPPTIPITQIVGFNQFTADSAAPIIGTETTASLTYADLATVGPQITGLADGKYIVIFGCTGFNSVGTTNQFMSVKYGAAEAADNDALLIQSTVITSATRAIAITVSGGGNNTIKARYKTDAGTASFLRRWMIAFRYANA